VVRGLRRSPLGPPAVRVMRAVRERGRR